MQILLMYSTHTPSERHITRLHHIDSSIAVRVASKLGTAVKEAKNAQIIFGHHFLAQCLPYAENLRWVQSTAAGIDRLPLESLTQKGVELSNMNVSAPVIARHAITLAWSLARCLPAAYQRQASGIWDDSFQWLPWPRKAYVIGTGKIGSELAKMLTAEGLEVTGAKRTPAEPPASSSCFTKIYDKTSWRNGLPSADWCFLALPHTSETTGLMDEAALRALPPHAILINIGRGETLETDALCRVLNEGHLGGAALDVIHPRPKGPEDPIWLTPRMVITPHCGAHHLERADIIERFCEAQLVRYMAGRRVLNLVNLENPI